MIRLTLYLNGRAVHEGLYGRADALSIAANLTAFVGYSVLLSRVA